MKPEPKSQTSRVSLRSPSKTADTPPTAPPTLADVARAAGTNTYSASVALRGHKGVSEPLRLRIEQEAKRLGYVHNKTAANMARLRWKNNVSLRGTLILLHESSQNKQAKSDAYTHQAHRLGYHFESALIPKSRRSLQAMLHAFYYRGIEGLIILPRHFGESLCEEDFQKFAVIHQGGRPGQSAFDSVTLNYYLSMSLLVQNVLDAGYRKPAFLTLEGVYANTGGVFLAAFRQACERLFKGAPLFSIVPNDRRMDTATNSLLARGADTIIFQGRGEACTDIHRALQTNGKSIGLCVTNCAPADDYFAGLLHPIEELQRNAVSLLHHAIETQRIGPHKYPYSLQIMADWHDGPSLPPCSN